MNLSILLGKSIPEIILSETLPELLQPSFEKHKEKRAFIFWDRKLSYYELDQWSNAIAHQLIDTGVQVGDKVGVWYKRSLELPVIILGIVKAGASYVPLDREMPLERVVKVFTDIQVKTYFSDEDIHIGCPPISVATQPADYVAALATAVDNRCWAYVLFTSGSTGNPKGIPVTHGNICHLVRAEQAVIGIKDSDIVYQGFSVSFDMWCEEVWISLFAGATIWLADAATVKAIDGLANVLAENAVTVLHAVPSILAIMDEVPSVRLVNSGGEACTTQVLQKWAKPCRAFYNSYGPTETTVTSNISQLQKEDALTIGAPLPNYNIAVVDEQMRIVPYGERGEMIISGPGVCHGYFNLPELTAQKFLPNPFRDLPGDRIYKTGDAVVLYENGFIDFQGRIDDQVKLRGYRIELGEIESRLNGLPGIKSAAVAVRQDASEQAQLVGYVTMEGGAVFDESGLRHQLVKFLAPYMVPLVIVPMMEMPRMPSGKIDRKKLPLPQSFMVDTQSENVLFEETDSVAAKVAKALQLVFPGKAIRLEQDFFTDLGGHSLLAATFVSHLRQKAGMSFSSLKDVYQQRPLSLLVKDLEEKQHGTSATNRNKEMFKRVSKLQYYLCNAAQTLVLLLVFGLLAIQIFFPYLIYYYCQVNGYGMAFSLLAAVLLYTFLPPFFSFIILLTKWLIIGKIKEGDYPLWGWYYFRWWIWKTVKRLTPSVFFVDTPLYPMYLRLLGVKVHPSAQLSLLSIGAEDLVTIEENVSTSAGCVIENATVENGILKIRKVHIKSHAYVGSSSVVSGGTTVEPFGELEDLSCLRQEHVIGRGEVWDGSPAEKVRQKSADAMSVPKLAKASTRRRFAFLYAVSLFLFPLIIVVPLAPTLYIIYYLDEKSPSYNFGYLWQTPFLALSYILLFIGVVVGITRLLQYRMKPGVYSIFGFTYYRKWIKDQVFSMSLTVLHPLFATLYVLGFYRALGAKVGKNSEISTASDVSHNLLEIGEGSFIADAVFLGEHDVRNEQLVLRHTKIGNNSFVGNSGLVPQDYEMGDNMLIGVLSKAPNSQQLLDSHHAKDWLGTPPIPLPRREKLENFDPERTFRPSLKLKVQRGLVEGLRIIFPQTIILVCSVLFIAYTSAYIEKDFVKMLWITPFYYLGIVGLPTFFVTVLLKWVLVGKYRHTALPMYSARVWFSEAVTTVYEALPVPFFLDYLRGTMWLPFFMRFLGVKIGKRVFLNTTDITEFDMVSIGNESMLNEDCGPQTHLFEDRIMKVGSVKIGERSTISGRTIILYDSEIGNNVVVDPLSLIMKGEVLSDNTKWGGNPLRAEF